MWQHQELSEPSEARNPGSCQQPCVGERGGRGIAAGAGGGGEGDFQPSDA